LAEVYLTTLDTNRILPAPTLFNSVPKLAEREAEPITVEKLLPACLITIHNVTPVLRNLSSSAKIPMIQIRKDMEAELER
jgi:hypothetical protein